MESVFWTDLMKKAGSIDPPDKDEKSFFRLCIVSRTPVLFSLSSKKGRPASYVGNVHALHLEKEEKHDKACPFCVGNEDLTGEALYWIDSEGKVRTSEPDKGKREGWKLRVVYNAFPAVVHGKEKTPGSFGGLYLQYSAAGEHVVIVESPIHNMSIATASQSFAERFILSLFHTSETVLKRDPTAAHICIFKNHGPSSGGSLKHPHSQMVTLPFIPTNEHNKLSGAALFYQEHKQCVYCRMIEDEEKDLENDGLRIIWKNSEFIVFVPFAAEVSFHLLILPLKHNSDFFKSQRQHKAFAEALRVAMKAVYIGGGHPSLNWSIHTRPLKVPEPWKNVDQFYHWHLELRPRAYHVSGFEIGTGIRFNWTLPEEDAQILRKALTDNGESVPKRLNKNIPKPQSG